MIQIYHSLELDVEFSGAHQRQQTKPIPKDIWGCCQPVFFPHCFFLQTKGWSKTFVYWSDKIHNINLVNKYKKVVIRGGRRKKTSITTIGKNVLIYYIFFIWWNRRPGRKRTNALHPRKREEFGLLRFLMIWINSWIFHRREKQIRLKPMQSGKWRDWITYARSHETPVFPFLYEAEYLGRLVTSNFLRVSEQLNEYWLIRTIVRYTRIHLASIEKKTCTTLMLI